MSTADRIRKAADLMVDRGLTVKWSSGWESRGRPYSFNPSAGVICHHTASAVDSDSVLINGRPDLPGPLCHYALHLDGTVVVIAAGYANHAGESVPGAPTNSTGWGIEATGPYPNNNAYGVDAFPNYDEYTVMVACILEAEGWSTSKVWAHKESCSPAGRKPDPHFDMDPFRSAVASGGGDELANSDEILSIVKRIEKRVDMTQFGDAAGGGWDSHDHLSVEGIHMRLVDIDKRLDQLTFGDQAGGGGDTHDYLSVEGVHRKLDEVTRMVKELLEGTAPAQQRE